MQGPFSAAPLELVGHGEEGVTPIPPATMTCRVAPSAIGKVQRGMEAATTSPSFNSSCTQALPPRNSASRLTAISQVSARAVSPHML